MTRNGLLVALVVVAGCGPPMPARQAAPPASLRQALTDAWHAARALGHPLLADAGGIEPSFDDDAAGLRSAHLSYIRNAVWQPKAAGPGPKDAGKPYVWITVSLWRPGADAQPTTTTRGLRVDGKQYGVDVRVVSSDPALSARLDAFLSRAFAGWHEAADGGR